MIDKKVLVACILVVSITGIGFFSVFINNTIPQQVPPPPTLPDGSVQIESSGALLVWAEAVYWQDFMPAIPPEGAPFYCLIKVNITNIGDSTIEDLFAPRATVYYNSTFQPLVTLNLTTVAQFFAPLSISPGESIVVEFINERSSIFSPSIEEGTGLYSQVLFRWENAQEVILTTAPSELLFTF